MIDITSVYKDAQHYIENCTSIATQPFSQTPLASVPVIALSVFSETYKSSIMHEEIAKITIKCLACSCNYITDCGKTGIVDMISLLDAAMIKLGYSRNVTPPYRDAINNWCAIITYSKHGNKF